LRVHVLLPILIFLYAILVASQFVYASSFLSVTVMTDKQTYNLGEDVNINGTLKYVSATPLWNKTWGGNNADNGWSVAIDSANNIIIVGETCSFGVGDYDAFVVKYDSFGVQLWNRTWGGSQNDYGRGVTVDSADNIIVVGWTYSFGVGGDAFVVKYDSFGVQLWNRTWGGSQFDYGRNVAVNLEGDIVVVGWTKSFGVGDFDAFVVKYDSFGVQLWNKTWGGVGMDVGRGVAVDSANNIVVVGDTYSFGVGGYDAFVVRYDSFGVQLWNKTWGGSQFDYGWGVAVDSYRDIIIVGKTFSFGVGDFDAFVVRYDSFGVQLWNKTWGGEGTDVGFSVAVDLEDNMAVAGWTDSFGVGGYDAFVVRYDSFGVQLWNRTWGGSQFDYGWGIVIDSLGNIIVTGSTYSFGAGNDDAFILVLSELLVLVPDGLVAIQVDYPSTYGCFTVRTRPTGSLFSNNWTIEILQLYPSDSGGNPKNSFQRGTMAYFTVEWRNNDDIPHYAIIILNLYDANNVPFMIWAPSGGMIEPGEAQNGTFSTPIPTDATLGNATVYANVVSGWPKYGGFAYGPEKSADFTITSTASGSSTSESQTVNLVSIEGTYNLTFHLPTIGGRYGNYTVYVSSFYKGQQATGIINFEVGTLLGDISGDGVVDITDLVMLIDAWGSYPGHPKWNPKADLNNDGVVDITDLVILISNWGAHT